MRERERGGTFITYCNRPENLISTKIVISRNLRTFTVNGFMLRNLQCVHVIGRHFISFSSSCVTLSLINGGM